jgi:hypothetical protein
VRLSFLTSIPMMSRVDESTFYSGFYSLLVTGTFNINTLYMDSLIRKKSLGNDLFLFGKHTPIDMKTYLSVTSEISPNIVFSFSKTDLRENKKLLHAGKLKTSSLGIVIYPKKNSRKDWSSDYINASIDPEIKMIAIAAGNIFERESFIFHLMNEKIFESGKEHCLLGLPNPAELSTYRSYFSNFLSGSIKSAICSECFIYSVYGISFSQNKGIFEYLPTSYESTFDGVLGISQWMNYEMDMEQIRLFYSNVSIIRDFASGERADKYLSKLDMVLKDS